jgi:glycosyltransferase involved in cell wall biosynthesis
MRIVHISTHDVVGGAARAAFRLHKALLAAGEESSMLVNCKGSDLDSVHQAPWPQEFHSLLGYLVQTHWLDRNRTPLSNTWFSLGWPGLDLSRHPVVQRADILHLHWVSSCQSPPTLAGLLALGKPIVWTLHDQRAFTGGCHYSAGCTNYETGCAACPQLASDPFGLPAANLADQIELLPGTKVAVVAPSRWMAECARRSAVFREARIEWIPNSVETGLFRPNDKSQAKSELGWPAGALCLLFGADQGNERRKGFGELMAAFKLCAADRDFARRIREKRLCFFYFGHPSPELNDAPVPVQSLGHIGSEAEMARVYAAADLFLLPSLEDNLPNTVLESMSCGTAVAAFRTGGVPDLVIEGSTGRLAPTGDVREFSRIILSLASDPNQLQALARSCRRHAEDNFTLSRQTQECRELYRDLLQKCTAGPSVSRLPARVDAGPHFQKAFPRILGELFARNVELLPMPQEPAAIAKHESRRIRFLAQTKNAVAEAASGVLSYPEFMTRLGTEWIRFGGKSPLRMKLKGLLKEMFT